MSIRKRVARDPSGEVVLTVKVTGAADVFRFATSMLGMRRDFADIGRKSLRSLRESIGRREYLELDGLLHRRSRGSGAEVVWFTLRGGQVLHATVPDDGSLPAPRVVALCGRSGLIRSRADDDADTRRCPSCVSRVGKSEAGP